VTVICSNYFKYGSDDCLEAKKEDYQNCSVLYRVLQLCTVINTFIWAVLTGELYSACMRFLTNLCVLCLLYVCCRFTFWRWVSVCIFFWSLCVWLSVSVQFIARKDLSPKWPVNHVWSGTLNLTNTTYGFVY